MSNRTLRAAVFLFLLLTATRCVAGTPYPQCPDQVDPFSQLGPYTRDPGIPAVGEKSGQYTNEFSSAEKTNTDVVITSLPHRPYLGTELYWEATPDTDEAQWFRQLGLDFVRVEVTPKEIVDPGRNDSRLPVSFPSSQPLNFELGNGWRFNNPASSVTNILQNSYGVRFPLMMMMHYGGEGYMGNIPKSADYADYFLATVYYYNVIRNLNVKYWEVLNEPDWGYSGQRVTPEDYAAIFRQVAQRIKSFPDARVNSVVLGGPALGSGDPIDGNWPDGYANRDSNGNRDWRDYVPTLLKIGSRDGQCDIGFLSWHDYGSDTWGTSNSIYNLNQNYALVNRVNAFAALSDNYTGGKRSLPLIVSEMNLAAGETNAQTKAAYKDFYAALWHTSTLNNYFSTGQVTMISPFFWKGDNHWPKGLVYQDIDSNNKLVRTPIWWAYREYLQHTQSRILASYNGKQNPWADAIVTTDDIGKMFYLVAINKSADPQTIDFSFNVPNSLFGQVVISKETMQKGGEGEYGSPFADPVVSQAYTFQTLNLTIGKQVRYRESLPPRTIVYYTVIHTAE